MLHASAIKSIDIVLAMRRLSQHLEHGVGIPRDDAQALRLLEQAAADLGYDDAARAYAERT